MKNVNLLTCMRKVAVFALPISAGGIINAIANFISMMMVARLGKEELAAGSLAIATFLTVMTVTATVFYAVAILISHSRSQHKSPMETGLILKNGFWLAFLLAIPAAASLWYADKLLILLGQDPKLVALTRDYFHFASITMFPTLACTVIMQFCAGIGKPRFTLFIALITLPSTILLSYGYVLGHFGLPQLGLGGVSCASLIVQLCLLLVLLIFMYFRKEVNVYGLFNKPFLPNWLVCKSILSLGLPIGMQFGGEFMALTAATYLMGYFGVTALAASQIVGQYYMVSIICLLGFTQALSVLTSEAYGKSDSHLMKGYAYASVVLLLIFSTLVSILFIGFPQYLIQFYLSEKIVDSHIEQLAMTFFIISSILLFFDGLRHLFSSALRGMRDSHGPMWIGITSLWLMSIPLCYLLGFAFQGGPIGLRIGFLSGFIFSAVMLLLRLRKKLYLPNKLNENYHEKN